MLKKGYDELLYLAYILRQEKLDLECSIRHSRHRQQLFQEELATVLARIRQVDLFSGLRCGTTEGEQALQLSRERYRADARRLTDSVQALQDENQLLCEEGRRLDTAHAKAASRVEAQQGVWLDLLVSLKDDV